MTAHYFPGTRGNVNGDILIVGEAWGADEARQGKPFVGASGREVDALLREARIPKSRCLFTNVVNAQPAGNDMTQWLYRTVDAKKAGLEPYKGIYPKQEIFHGILELQKVINAMKPELIIGFGNWALWALTDQWKIGNSRNPSGYKIPTGIAAYRGSQLYTETGQKLLVTYHPAAVLRQWDLRHIVLHDLRSRAPLAAKPGAWDEPERNYLIRPSFEETMNYLSDIQMRAKLSSTPLLVANDIETHSILLPNKNGRQVSRRYIECVGFAHNAKDAICIPFAKSDGDGNYWDSTQEEVAVMVQAKKTLEDPNVEIVGQNFLYDYQYYKTFWGCRPNYKQDTMLAHHVCFPGIRMGLDFISSFYCAYHCYWKDDGKEASKDHNDEQRWVYNARDCVVTYEAMEQLWGVIKFFGLEQQYALQMQRARAAVTMMIKGIAIDEHRRTEELKIHIDTVQGLENRMMALIPESFVDYSKKTPWYRSNAQLAEFFYDTMLMKPIFSKATGNPTVDDEALRKLADRDPMMRPLCETLQSYRSLETFAGFLNMTTGLDGRLRSSFSPTTETFRYRSSSDPFGYGRNVQNIPAGNEDYE